MSQALNTTTSDGIHELFSKTKLKKEAFASLTYYYSYITFVKVLEELQGSKKFQVANARHAEVYDKASGLYAIVQDVVITNKDTEGKYRPSIVLVRAENGVYMTRRGTELVPTLKAGDPRRTLLGYDADVTELPALGNKTVVLHLLGNLNVEAAPLDVNSPVVNSVMIRYAVKMRDARLYRWLKWPFPADVLRAAYPDVYDRLFREPSEKERRMIIVDYYREMEGQVATTIGEFRVEMHGVALDDGSVLSDRLEVTASHPKFGKRSVSVNPGQFYVFKFTNV